METIHTIILSFEAVYFVGLIVFTYYIGKEYDQLNKFKNGK